MSGCETRSFTNERPSKSNISVHTVNQGFLGAEGRLAPGLRLFQDFAQHTFLHSDSKISMQRMPASHLTHDSHLKYL
jgi:hypothetical protein